MLIQEVTRMAKKKIDVDVEPFMVQLVLDHENLINDIVKTAIKNSETWGDAHKYVDKLEIEAGHQSDNTGDGSMFLGILRRTQAELTRRERKQKINHDYKDKD